MQIHQDTRNFDAVTHLVTTQDDQGLSPRTEKYLRGILAGIWIVNRSCKRGKFACVGVCVCLDSKDNTLFYAGIEDSSEKGKWLAEEPYEVMGDTVAGKTHGPRRARQALAEDEVYTYITLDIEKRRKLIDVDIESTL